MVVPRWASLRVMTHAPPNAATSDICAAQSPASTPARRNTVQLDHHGLFWKPLGLGPLVVAGSLDVPFGVLAFDDAGVGSGLPRW